MSVTVTWDAGTNGGTVNGSAAVTTSVTSGSTATAPSQTPVKAGHSFRGWYTSASGGSLYNTVTVSAARTFYAQFTASQYTITWDLGDGDTETTSQTYGQALVLPATPSRDGYTFQGWYTSETGGTQVTDSTTYTTAGPSTYYAPVGSRPVHHHLGPGGRADRDHPADLRGEAGPARCHSLQDRPYLRRLVYRERGWYPSGRLHGL